MLRLIRRHTAKCDVAYQKKNAAEIAAKQKPLHKPEGDYKCVHKCSFVAVGPNPAYDPMSPDPRKQKPRIKETLDTDHYATALKLIKEMELDLLAGAVVEPPPATITLADALREFMASKDSKSRERRGKNERVIFRRQTLFLASRFGIIDSAVIAQWDVKITNPEEVKARAEAIYAIAAQIPIKKPGNLDVDAFIRTLKGKIKTRKDERSLIRSFWGWVQVKGLRPDNIAFKAEQVASAREERIERNKRIPTFSHEEYAAYMRLLKDPVRCAEVLKAENNQDFEASEKTRYLAILQVETAMALGDCVTFRGGDMQQPLTSSPTEVPIIHTRLKTGQIARPFIPLSLAQEIRTKFKWDSAEYPFWSGVGDPENRGKTYRARLKKLFIAAGIRVYKTAKRKKIGGVTQDFATDVLDTHADPHFWRHSWVRDAYLVDMHPRKIASWLGDTIAAVEKYYSVFDNLRHQQLASAGTEVRAVRPAVEDHGVAI